MRKYILLILLLLGGCGNESDYTTGYNEENKANSTPCLSIRKIDFSDWVYIYNFPDEGDCFSFPLDYYVGYFDFGNKSVYFEVAGIGRDFINHQIKTITIKLNDTTFLKYPDDSCD